MFHKIAFLANHLALHITNYIGCRSGAGVASTATVNIYFHLHNIIIANTITTGVILYLYAQKV